ncbi:unnamed protein product, partial [Discosporangium mesarthrocarpum]
GVCALRDRCGKEETRLRDVEQALVRLKEEAKYGSRRAALEEREGCLKKIEKSEGEKWALKADLTVERREVESLRQRLKHLKENQTKAQAAAEGNISQARVETTAERRAKEDLQDQVESLRRHLQQFKEEQTKSQALTKDSISRACRETEAERRAKEDLQDQVKGLQQHLQQLKEDQTRAQAVLEDDISRAREETSAERRSKEDLQDQVKNLMERMVVLGKTELLNERIRNLEESEVSLRQEREGLVADRQELQAVLLSKEGEVAQLSRLLREEQAARSAQSAMGDAVFRELRAAQGLLKQEEEEEERVEEEEREEVSFDMRQQGQGNKFQYTPGSWPANSGSLEKGVASQLAVLEHLLGEADDLVGRTSSFYDSYSALHASALAVNSRRWQRQSQSQGLQAADGNSS